MFDSGLGMRHVVLALVLLFLPIAWSKIRPRLPGAFGKNLGDAVEIVPTVGMRLEAWGMPPLSLALLALFAALLSKLPPGQLLVAAFVVPLWFGGLLFGLARFRAIRTVRRLAIRYDAENFSVMDHATGARESFAFADVEWVEPRWFASDLLHVAGRTFEFVEDAGGAPRFLDRVPVEAFNPQTDRAPG